MYLSQVDLDYQRLPPSMLSKLDKSSLYALHQWLWQLFPEQENAENKKRDFLFRQEALPEGQRFYLLSQCLPSQEHNLLSVNSKRFEPKLHEGQTLHFSLRANPVVTRNGKRFDVLMDAKYRAKRQTETPLPESFWPLQQQAAIDWLTRQSEQKGFKFETETLLLSGYQQYGLYKPKQPKKGEPASANNKNHSEIRFGSVDFQGVLTITNVETFMQTLAQGLGKSRAFGCGLLLIKPVRKQ